MATKFNKTEAFKNGWKLFKKHWKFLVPLLAILWIVSSVVDNILASIYQNSEAIGLILQLGLYFVNAVVGVGLVKIFLNILDGKPHSWRLLYQLYPRGLRNLAAGFLYTLMVVLGLLLFVVPGVYLALRYQFFMYEIADKNTGIIDSFKNSAKLTRGNIWNLFLFELMCIGIGLLGLLALGVGLIVAVPVIFFAFATVYRKLE